MRRIRTYHEVEDPAGREVLDQVVAQRRRLDARLAGVRHVVAIGSGKGGVGKSAVTANLAAALAVRGLRVGAADADLNGPSLARMLGAAGQRLRVGEVGVEPAAGAGGVRVMSMDLLLAADDAPLRWRAAGATGAARESAVSGASDPVDGSDVTGASGVAAMDGRSPDPAAESLWQSSFETGALREFLADTVWGELDFLLIDVAPGTDKLARLFRLLPEPPVTVLVTTPSEMARFVVAKSVRLAREAGTPAIGLVANMSAYVCDGCGRTTALYHADGARRLADEAGVPLWAEIPFDPRLAVATDSGAPVTLGEADALTGGAATAAASASAGGESAAPGAPRSGTHDASAAARALHALAGRILDATASRGSP